MSLVGDNIKSLRILKNLTQSALADKIGISRPIIGAYEEGRAQPKLKTLQNLALVFSTTVDALLNANLSENYSDYAKSYLEGSAIRVLPIVVNEENNELITVVPFKAHAGYLNGYADTEWVKEELTKFSLPLNELPTNKTYRLFQITGDSMMPINSGTYIITEYLDNWKNIKDETCYVFITKDDGIVYKRALNKISETNEIIFKSDNPDYPPYPVTANNILEVWKAIGFISFNIPDQKDLQIEKLSSLVMELKQEVNNIRQKKK